MQPAEPVLFGGITLQAAYIILFATALHCTQQIFACDQPNVVTKYFLVADI